jgi:hypothetical protein
MWAHMAVYILYAPTMWAHMSVYILYAPTMWAHARTAALLQSHMDAWRDGTKEDCEELCKTLAKEIKAAGGGDVDDLGKVCFFSFLLLTQMMY